MSNLNKLYVELAQLGKPIPFQEVFVLAKPSSGADVKPAKDGKDSDGKRKDKAKDDAAKNKPEKTMAKAAPASMAKLLGGDSVGPESIRRSSPGACRLAAGEPKAAHFAQVIVNRVWANYFNVGIIQPIGRISIWCHPPSNPELLEFV